MHKKEFSFSHDGSVAPNKIELGHDGDHNANTLVFTPDEVIKENTEYYRIFIDGFSSEPIYLLNDKVEFLVPNGVLNAGVQFIQIKCYGTKSGEVSLILCSDIITACTGHSLHDGIEIPEELRADATTIKKELADLVVRGTEINDTVAENAKIASESAEIARVCCNTAVAAKDEVAENTAKVLTACEQTLAAEQSAANAMYAAKTSAKESKNAAAIAAIHARSINDLGEITQSILEYSEVEYILCQDQSIEVVNSEWQGAYFENCYRTYIKIDVELKPNTTYTVTSNTYYEVGSSLTDAITPSYISLGDIENKVVTENIVCEGDITNYSFVKTTFTTPETMFINGPLFMAFEHNATGNFIDADMLVTISAKGMCPTGVNVYSKPQVDEMVGDIEAALDNIIAIQNTLIGGEGE